MADPHVAGSPTVAPTVAVAGMCVVALGVVGLVFGRPDVVALTVPLLLCVVGPLQRRRALSLTLDAATEPDTDVARPVTRVRVDSGSPGADLVQLSLTQGVKHTTQLSVGGHSTLRARSRVLHSGPSRLINMVARGVSEDGALVWDETPRTELHWQAMPAATSLPVLPVAPRLTGLHGAHEGARPGHGGDFRDIHPFVPGDELRRVDWRATARAARRPGELMVRRTNTLSDASVVLVVDNVDELGESVASWGTGDTERSGITSLDLAREAARSIAEATVAAGDRVAYHEITPGGRSVRSGSGPRHLARVLAAVAATGQRGEESVLRRTPPIPTGSVVYLLSTFFDGSAARLALTWRASGHRVVAVDVLPTPDRERLSPRQQFALRIVLAERAAMFEDLAGGGIDVVAWGEGAEAIAVDLRLAARVRR